MAAAAAKKKGMRAQAAAVVWGSPCLAAMLTQEGLSLLAVPRSAPCSSRSLMIDMSAALAQPRKVRTEPQSREFSPESAHAEECVGWGGGAKAAAPGCGRESQRESVSAGRRGARKCIRGELTATLRREGQRHQPLLLRIGVGPGPQEQVHHTRHPVLDCQDQWRPSCERRQQRRSELPPKHFSDHQGVWGSGCAPKEVGALTSAPVWMSISTIAV